MKMIQEITAHPQGLDILVRVPPSDLLVSVMTVRPTFNGMPMPHSVSQIVLCFLRDTTQTDFEERHYRLVKGLEYWSGDTEEWVYAYSWLHEGLPFHLIEKVSKD